MTSVPSDGPIRVMVVDDHPLLREGITALMQSQPGIECVAEAGNGQEAVAGFLQHRPDVTLMDLQMPVMDGISAMTAIQADHPDARIVMLTTYRGDAQALRALKAGASGYLLKSTIIADLLDAIRVVHSGQKFIPREIAAELAAHVTDDALSSRELEVLLLVASGNSNKRVADQLCISEDAVKARMKSILSKLSAKDRTHAVTIAMKRGIIDV